MKHPPDWRRRPERTKERTSTGPYSRLSRVGEKNNYGVTKADKNLETNGPKRATHQANECITKAKDQGTHGRTVDRTRVDKSKPRQLAGKKGTATEGKQPPSDNRQAPGSSNRLSTAKNLGIPGRLAHSIPPEA